jgi:uridylate kinase
MDVAAMILCNDNAMELVVCNINKSGALLDLANGKMVGTRVTHKEA